MNRVCNLCSWQIQRNLCSGMWFMKICKLWSLKDVWCVVGICWKSNIILVSELCQGGMDFGLGSCQSLFLGTSVSSETDVLLVLVDVNGDCFWHDGNSYCLEVADCPRRFHFIYLLWKFQLLYWRRMLATELHCHRSIRSTWRGCFFTHSCCYYCLWKC